MSFDVIEKNGSLKDTSCGRFAERVILKSSGNVKNMYVLQERLGLCGVKGQG